MIEDEIKNREYKQYKTDAMPQKKATVKPMPKLTGTVNPPVKINPVTKQPIELKKYTPGVPNRVMEKKPIQRKKPR